MIKVVIADDEEKVCQLICNLVDWNACGMEIVAVAHNGVEALETIKAFSPDLMVTDIRMPGCDGLELISRAKQLDSRLEFIIISGYRHFEYAQSAVKYGVGDYLLKPIKKDELTATLNKMRERYRKRTEQLSEQEQLQMRLQNDVNRLRASFFTDFLLRDKAAPAELELTEVNGGYHYQMAPGCFQIFAVKIDSGEELLAPDEFHLLKEKLTRIIKGLLCPHCTDMEIYFQGSMVWGLLNYPNEKRSAVRRQLKAVLDELMVQKTVFPQEFTIGIGTVEESAAALPRSREAARCAVSQRLVEGTGKLLEKPPQKPCGSGEYTYPSEIRKAMENGIEILDTDQVLGAVTALQQSAERCENATGEEMLFLTGELCKTYVQLVRNLHFDQGDAEELYTLFLQKSDSCCSAGALWDCLRQIISDSMESIAGQRRQEETKPIRAAKKYIQECYQNPVTLEEVSAVVGFNATYFSTLFKKETGQNFLEYLSEIRMDKAKELLKETGFSVAQICELVGYSDLKYFTKSFKKSTGIKPGEYRKLYA